MYYMPAMSTVMSRCRTIMVRLPEALADEIEAESRKRGVSKSDVIRERLERVREAKELPAALADIADVIGAADGRPFGFGAMAASVIVDRTGTATAYVLPVRSHLVRHFMYCA